TVGRLHGVPSSGDFRSALPTGPGLACSSNQCREIFVTQVFEVVCPTVMNLDGMCCWYSVNIANPYRSLSHSFPFPLKSTARSLTYLAVDPVGVGASQCRIQGRYNMQQVCGPQRLIAFDDLW